MLLLLLRLLTGLVSCWWFLKVVQVDWLSQAKPFHSMTDPLRDFSCKIKLPFFNDVYVTDLLALFKESETPFDIHLLQIVAELKNWGMSPLTEARDRHHEIQHTLKALAFNLGQRPLEVAFIESSEITIVQTCHSCSTRFICKQSKLPERLGWPHLLNLSHRYFICRVPFMLESWVLICSCAKVFAVVLPWMFCS